MRGDDDPRFSGQRHRGDDGVLPSVVREGPAAAGRPPVRTDTGRTPRLLRRRMLGLLALLPAACTSPNPNLYTLAVVPGPVHSGAPARIELRLIALAHYLDRTQIVRSSEDFRLDVLGNDWWGEPLDSMLSRVLVQELSQRLPSSTVYGENSAITVTPDASVELNVQRMDKDRSGAVLLLAQVAVTRAGQVTHARNLRFAVPSQGAGTAGLVGAMSVAVGELADAVAETLTASHRR